MRLVVSLMDVLMFQVGSIAAGSSRGCVPPGHGAPAQEGEGEDSQAVCLRGLWINKHLEVRCVCVCVCVCVCPSSCLWV